MQEYELENEDFEFGKEKVIEKSKIKKLLLDLRNINNDIKKIHI